MCRGVLNSMKPSQSEKRIRSQWDKKKIYEPDIAKAKRPFYNLMMFPYPSAEGLHIGGVRTFTGIDMYGRFKRMQGYDVFEPIGLDGFGIHSENYAMKIKAHPMRLAGKTEKRFYEQLAVIGNGFAWNERLETYDPDYYKWTQWIFIQLYKNGLAYRKKALVNWCPSCLTVLSDEQVVSGECERCGTAVVKKDLEQWFFRITKYAERMLRNLDTIDWSENIKMAQRNWIGKSDGAEIDFKILGAKERIRVFTTRPDTLFGATYMVLAPEHPLVSALEEKIENRAEVSRYVRDAKKKSEMERTREEKEKTGVLLRGVKALNPANGEGIPVFIADYVLAGYGTGAIMAVPAHDKRDFQFANQFKLPIRMVVCPHYPEKTCPVLDTAYEGQGHLVDSGKFNGMKSEDAKKEITGFVGGTLKTTYRLRDWLISRQRYWGPPIPMIHCERCGIVPVPEKDLPVKLPFIKDFQPKGKGESPLASLKSFYQVKCPQCKGKARRETDVSDTFLDSAWYFFRYLDIKNKKNIFDATRVKKWLPVDMYIGGAEHSVLHLLYTRFITMVLKDIGLISFEEPFKKFRAHGLITKDGAKMSKSKGNVVSPDAYFSKYGADVMRMYLAFLAPLSEGGDFRDAGISGITRFLLRVRKLFKTFDKNKKSSPNLQKVVHRSIKKVTEDLESLRYNTAISQLMIFLSEMEKSEEVAKDNIIIFLKLLAPFAPFAAEELWQKLNGKKIVPSIHTSEWPTYDPRYLEDSTYVLVIQVNGKIRDQVDVPMVISQKDVEALVETREKIKPWIFGKKIKKIIFVPKKLINIVV